MAKLWLPMNIKYQDREMDVFVPRTGDPIYDHDLEQWAEEKTLDDLRKRQPKPKAKLSRKETIELLKDYRKYWQRKQSTVNRKYR